MSGAGRVLIAENDEAIRRLISRVLDHAGVPHDAVRDGSAAIELLQSREYAVVLIDLMMPVVNGYELLAWLRDQPRRPKSVIVMTAVSDSDLRRLDEGLVTAIVRKPFDIPKLSAFVCDAATSGRAFPPKKRLRSGPKRDQGALNASSNTFRNRSPPRSRRS